MKIEVKKRTWLLTDADCVEFAYGIDKFPYSEELLECENNIPHVTWEHVYIMHIMKIMMQFPNSTITCNQSMLGENQTIYSYSVTNYIVSVINDVGVECATYVSPFKSLLQLNGCKTNRLIESLLLTKFGNIRNVHYTVDNDDIILVKLDTIKMMYSVPDVASMIGVTSRTLYNWCCSNIVNYRRTENGRIYFTNDDVDRLQQSILSGNIQLKHRGKRHKKKEEKEE